MMMGVSGAVIDKFFKHSKVLRNAKIYERKHGSKFLMNAEITYRMLSTEKFNWKCLIHDTAYHCSVTVTHN